MTPEIVDAIITEDLIYGPPDGYYVSVPNANIIAGRAYCAGLEAVKSKTGDLNTYNYRHDWQALEDWIAQQLKEANENTNCQDT